MALASAISIAHGLARWLNRVWRLFATLLCFAVFGAGSVLLSMLWFQLLPWFVRDAAKRKQLARRNIAGSFRLFLWLTRVAGVLNYQIEGAAQLLTDREQPHGLAKRGCLIVANHPTLLDYILLVSILPQTDCLVKSALQANLFVSGIIRAADYLLNSQAADVLPLCQARLAAGETIVIFPEGTRTKPGCAMTLQRGAAQIAVRCQCDMRLVFIHCSEPFLSKTSRWYNVPAHKPCFRIVVGERVNIHDFSDKPQPLAARALNRHLLGLFADELS